MQTSSVHMHHVWSLPLPDFLHSRPSEVYLRLHVLPKVGEKWRAVCTYLGIPSEDVQKQLESHIGNVDETLFSLLSVWSARKGATWGALLAAFRKADMNAQANRLQEWVQSGAASVSCEVMWRVASRGIQQWELCRPAWRYTLDLLSIS